jgi:hypothetical protein
VHTGFWWGNLSEVARSRCDGRLILKWIFKKCDGGMDWTYLAVNRDW